MSDLLNAIRQIALTTKLPCGKEWYHNNEIEFDLNDEVSIYPMTHKDEILIHNPDALFSNNAVAQVIKSCCPNINKVEEIYMPDVEVLLLAIKIASDNDEIEVLNVCPKCLELYNETPEKDREQLKKDKKVYIEPQPYIFDARACLESFTPKASEYTLDLTDTIRLNLVPTRLKDNTKIELLNWETQNAIKTFLIDNKEIASEEENASMILDINNWQKNKEKNDNFNKLLVRLDEIVIDSLTTSVDCISVNGKNYTDKEDIKEFLTNIPAKMFDQIRTKVQEIGETSLNKTYYCKCKLCGHEWSSNDLDFNFSNFFVQGS